MHLLYSRFFTRALSDCGYMNIKEPFAGLLTQGMVCHQTYREAGNGNSGWLFPEEVSTSPDGDLIKTETGGKVSVGRSEKMSKSRKNVVDPESIIDSYGADTARLFMLSDSPAARDLEWTEAGIEGAWRYANRLWRLLAEPQYCLGKAGLKQPTSMPTEADVVVRKTHRAIVVVSADFDAFRFNRAVARIRELTNDVNALAGDNPENVWARRLGYETIVQLIGPVMPHLAEELWELLGHRNLLAETPWPIADKQYLVEDTVTIAVQVNGKLRGTLEIPPNAGKEETEAMALSLENVQRTTKGLPPRKVIVVPNKVINIVV